MADAGAQIGEEAEVLADGEQRAAFWLLVGREVFPLRAADGAEEDGVSLLAGFDGLLGQRLADRVDGGTADELVLVVEGEAGRLATVSRTRRASAMTSGPMPSPGRTASV